MGFSDLFAPRDDHEISIDDALITLSQGGRLIDVRSQREYEAGHIPGARLVAITELREDALTAIWGDDPLAMIDPATQEKTIVVVSSSPLHASAVAHLLRTEDLDARPLAGGLAAWVRDGQVLIPGD